jgi:ABC-type branched-subunit amino acid transport system ATPase component
MSLLRVERLTKTYLGVRAVDDVSFTVAPGEITGLIGPNGSGKSTTIDCLSAFQRADAGRWYLDGAELTGRAPHAIARRGLTRTFQAVRSYEALSLIDNLTCATEARQAVGWRDSFCATARLRTHESAARARAAELLDLVGLSRYIEAPAGILSYGQRKLLALAGALMTEPHIILLDEPVAGVNPTMIRLIEQAIVQINAIGIALLIVEHNVEFIMALCQRVIVLDAGRLLAEGPPAIIRDDPRVLEAYMGGAPDEIEAQLHA